MSILFKPVVLVGLVAMCPHCYSAVKDNGCEFLLCTECNYLFCIRG